MTSASDCSFGNANDGILFLAGLKEGALANYPYVVLVNVEIAELEGLREKVREATGKSWSFDHEVKVKDEAVLFCFEDPGAAWAFGQYCHRNHIPYRREP